MDKLYWIAGFIFIHALWAIPVLAVLLLMINGMLNVISIHIFYCLCKYKNKTDFTYFQILKSALRWRNYLEMCFTFKEMTLTSEFGVWRSKFDFTVYKK